MYSAESTAARLGSKPMLENVFVTQLTWWASGTQWRVIAHNSLGVSLTHGGASITLGG